MPSPDVITVSLNPAIDRVIEVENFTLGAHQTGREISRIPGGKGVNVSRVLAALDVQSIATGFLGKDNRSSFDSLFRSGLIKDEFFPVPGRTRENVTITDRKTAQETHIRDVGLEVDPRYIDRLTKKLRLLARPDSIVIFSGSLPPGMDAEGFAKLVEICISGGGRVAVDTSEDALRAMRGKRLWLVKPNPTELAQLVGRQLEELEDQLDAARELASTVQIVLFTRGAEGAYLLTRDTAVHACVSVDPKRIRNTVGCGDVLLGAFVAGICRDVPLSQAFSDAVAHASASACTIPTAEFEPNVVAELKSNLQLTEL